VTDADSHDRWVALVSHAPHVVAAAMAAQLAPESVPPEALSLAGSGLRDATRIAVGDAGLWTQILTGNAGPVAAVLAAVAADIAETAQILASGAAGPDDPATPEASKELTGLLEQGRAGVARIPGKRGGPARAFTAVQVVISDRPGELARLFAAAAGAGVNVEDVGIEHSPGAPVGVAELSVRPESAGALISALTAGGWPVRR
jgi:prephenate dehydrogenase